MVIWSFINEWELLFLYNSTTINDQWILDEGNDQQFFFFCTDKLLFTLFAQNAEIIKSDDEI